MISLHLWPKSRPSKTADWDYDFFIEFQAENQSQVVQVVEGLKKHTTQVRVIGSGTALQGGMSLSCGLCYPLYMTFSINWVLFFVETSVPWFPRKMSDLDSFAEKVLEMGEDLSKLQV